MQSAARGRPAVSFLPMTRRRIVIKTRDTAALRENFNSAARREGGAAQAEFAVAVIPDAEDSFGPRDGNAHPHLFPEESLAAFEDSPDSVRKAEHGEYVVACDGAERFLRDAPVGPAQGTSFDCHFRKDRFRIPEQKTAQIQNVRAENYHILSASAFILLAASIEGEGRSDGSFFDHPLHGPEDQRVAGKKRDGDFDVVLPGETDEFVRLLQIVGHRFFTENVDTDLTVGNILAFAQKTEK